MKHSGIEWIGQIPKEWDLVRAKSLFAQRNSKGNESAVLLSATQKQGMMPQSLLEGVVQVNNNTDLQTFKTVHVNDYVISLRSFQGGFEKSNYEGVCSPAYQVFYNIAPIDHNYYWLLFKSYGFVDKINSLTVGIREGKNIQYKDFANMILAVPPLSEQQKIADYLDKVCGEVDEMIALQEQMIEELKAYKQSVITEAVTKGLNPHVPMRDSGIDWIEEIPEHWKVAKLKYYIKVDSGDAITNEQLGETGLYPVYGGGEIMGYYSRYNTDDESLIIGRVGARCGCVTLTKGKSWATDNALIAKTDWQLKYVFYLLQGANLNRLNTSNAQPLITATKIKNVYVPILESDEQLSIASYLDTKCAEIDALIAIKQAKIEELKEYKKSVIYEYVTGKKEVV